MKKLLISLAVLGVFAAVAFASTDYKCMSDCSAQGYMYSYCKSQCSYGNVPERKGRRDYQCVTDCTAKGYMYSYCKDLCSY